MRQAHVPTQYAPMLSLRFKRKRHRPQSRRDDPAEALFLTLVFLLGLPNTPPFLSGSVQTIGALALATTHSRMFVRSRLSRRPRTRRISRWAASGDSAGRRECSTPNIRPRAGDREPYPDHTLTPAQVGEWGRNRICNAPPSQLPAGCGPDSLANCSRATCSSQTANGFELTVRNKGQTQGMGQQRQRPLSQKAAEMAKGPALNRRDFLHAPAGLCSTDRDHHVDGFRHECRVRRNTCLLDQLLDAYQRATRIVCMNSTHAARVSRVPGFEQRERAGIAHFAHDNTIRTQSHRSAQ